MLHFSGSQLERSAWIYLNKHQHTLLHLSRLCISSWLVLGTKYKGWSYLGIFLFFLALTTSFFVNQHMASLFKARAALRLHEKKWSQQVYGEVIISGSKSGQLSSHKTRKAQFSQDSAGQPESWDQPDKERRKLADSVEMGPVKNLRGVIKRREAITALPLYYAGNLLKKGSKEKVELLKLKLCQKWRFPNTESFY